MIETETFHHLRRQFDTASWAIWSEEYPRKSCPEWDSDELVEFLLAETHRFKPWIILLGLSRSTDKVSNYGNFHSPEFRHSDYILRISVEESGLDGAYMTDISKDLGPEASEVKVDENAEERFLRQLNLLPKKHFHVVCFGNDLFREVKKMFEGETRTLGEDITKYSVEDSGIEIDFYSVYHYSQRVGVNAQKHRKQLSYLAGDQMPLEIYDP